MECWSNGVMKDFHYSITPLLHYSNTPTLLPDQSYDTEYEIGSSKVASDDRRSR